MDYIQEVGLVLSTQRTTESCLEMPDETITITLTEFSEATISIPKQKETRS